MKKQHYTVGEIIRLGLLKKHDGKPHTDKAAVLRIVRGLYHTKVKTKWGPGYSVHKGELDRYNKKIKG